MPTIGRFPKHWSMLLMIIALQRWRARWERRNWRKSFTSVLKTTRMYSIPLQDLCSPLMTRVFLSGLSVPDDYTAHICESNGWQYLWSVPQDIRGLITLVGGKDRFAEKLDSMFTYIPAGKEDLPIFSTGMIGQYAHGNEPSHHVIYLYNKVRQPWKTQKYVAQVMHHLYFNAPAGLCGNEDCGQMSAWYVFSAMGFYPVNPVSGEYEIGTPLFPEIRMHLDNGEDFLQCWHRLSTVRISISGRSS